VLTVPLTDEKFDPAEAQATLERSGAASTVLANDLTKSKDRPRTHGQTNGRRPLLPVLKSPVSLGILFLLLINLALCLCQPFAKVEPRLLPATHTWTWWATKEFFEQKSTPPLVILGSSLVMHSISREDADYLNQELDYVHHHRSSYLEDQLKKRFHSSENIACFNFALPGDLVSDDYMIARALFNGERQPKYVIVGLSLRDFIDNAVNCPGTTPPFRYLKRFTDIDDLVDLAMPKFWQQFDYRFGKCFYIWGNKLDLQVLLDQAARKLLLPTAQRLGLPSLLNDLDYRKHVPSDLHSEVEEGMAMVKPHQPYSFDPNFADYRRRCGSPNEYMFKIQSIFFEKLVDLCKRKHICLVVLNMPLTKENLAIMPNGSYQKYLATVKRISERAGDTFVDLNQDPHFNHSDFYDTAHMNSAGGKKLLDILANLDVLRF
jgi:hypothetical protein